MMASSARTYTLGETLDFVDRLASSLGRPSPTPTELNDKILAGRRQGIYYSITTMPIPWLPWAPLPLHSDKESRLCHCSTSRVHRLRCGHTVAVQGLAEKCARNCAGMDMESMFDSRAAAQLGPDDNRRKTVQDMTNDSVAGLEAYGDTFLAGSTTAEALALYAILKRMNFTHQKYHRPDLAGGEFQCQECGTEGTRTSVPAYIYRVDPFHIIVPVRTAEDAALVRALRRGIRPRRELTPRRRAPRGGRGKHERPAGAGIDKARREEKRRVLTGMQEEQVLEAIAEMDPFS